MSDEIDSKLIGITASNGVKITGKSNHFIARTIGSVEQKRNGVSVEQSLDALTDKSAAILSPKVSNGGKSVKFRKNNVEVSVNPDTGNLIQVNPWSER